MSAKQKEAEYRDNLIGTDFTVCPSEERKLDKIQFLESTSQEKSYLQRTSLILNCMICITKVHFLQIHLTWRLENVGTLGLRQS